MVISKKPKHHSVDNRLVDQILFKGGSAIKSNTISENENENIKITIRLPKRMLKTIDNYLNNSIYTKPRNIWIKEAIEKKVHTDIFKENILSNEQS